MLEADANSPMRVLFITRTYPPLVGGMETFASNFYTNFGKLERIDLLANPGGLKTLAQFFLKALVFIFLNPRAYDVIHLYDAVLSPLIPGIRLFSNARISLTVNGLDVAYRPLGYQKVIPFFLKKADRVIAISEYTRSQCAARGISSEHLTVIPVGIDTSRIEGCAPGVKADTASRYGIDVGRKKILLTVGRLVRRKGHAWFISQVLSKLPSDYVYVIAGSGPEKEHLASLARGLDMGSRVKLIGSVSDEERDSLYELAHLFVIPNITVPGDQEGFGIVALEAGLRGLTVIASDIEGLRDAVVEGETGSLIREQDPRAFLAAVINPPHLDPAIIRQSVVSRFAWTVIAGRYHEEFQQLRTAK